MDRSEILKVLEAVLMFYDGSNITFIQERTGFEKRYVLVAAKVFKYLRFYPEDKLKQLQEALK